MFEVYRKEVTWGGKLLTFETGKIARQAEAARQKREAAERQAEYLHKKEEQKKLLNEQLIPSSGIA